MKKYGFIGTRTGMTADQKYMLEHLLKDASELIHGGCIGADDEADQIAAKLKVHRTIWPSDVHRMSISYSELLKRGPVTIMHQLRPLARNTCIVLNCEHLIAAPKEDSEVLRSGTWSTIRRARKEHKPLIILRRKIADAYPQDPNQHS